MSLKVVSWNCADSFPNKARRLLDLAAHIAIVPEVRAKHAQALGNSFDTIWEGEGDNRGLLVAARKPWRLEVVSRASARHGLLLRATQDGRAISILGIWAMPREGSYVRAVIEGLDELLPRIDTDDVIVAGDFNASPVLDRADSKQPKFDQITGRLHGQGLESLWHTNTGQDFGSEDTPTLYHLWKRERPFHIDFVFASRNLAGRLKSMTIGSFEDWCTRDSDHAPLVAEFRE